MKEEASSAKKYGEEKADEAASSAKKYDKE